MLAVSPISIQSIDGVWRGKLPVILAIHTSLLIWISEHRLRIPSWMLIHSSGEHTRIKTHRVRWIDHVQDSWGFVPGVSIFVLTYIYWLNFDSDDWQDFNQHMWVLLYSLCILIWHILTSAKHEKKNRTCHLRGSSQLLTWGFFQPPWPQGNCKRYSPLLCCDERRIQNSTENGSSSCLRRRLTYWSLSSARRNESSTKWYVFLPAPKVLGSYLIHYRLRPALRRSSTGSSEPALFWKCVRFMELHPFTAILTLFFFSFEELPPSSCLTPALAPDLLASCSDSGGWRRACTSRWNGWECFGRDQGWAFKSEGPGIRWVRCQDETQVEGNHSSTYRGWKRIYRCSGRRRSTFCLFATHALIWSLR